MISPPCHRRARMRWRLPRRAAVSPPAVAITTVLLLAAAGGSGCSSARKAAAVGPRRERTLAPDGVLARLRARNAEVRTLQGSGSMTIESPEGSHNGSFDAALKKPDSLCVELSGPLGIRVGSLFLSRDRFVFYNRLENTALAGKPDEKTLQSVLKLKMRFDDVMNAFTGEFPGVSDREDSLSGFAVNDEGFYVLTYRTAAGGRKEYHVDGDSFIVSRYRLFDQAGDLAVNASAGDVERDARVPMPRFLRIIFPSEHRSVTITYDEVTVNEPVECKWTIPRQAEIIERW